MKRWAVTLALCLLAVVLSVSLLHYTVSHNVTHEDYSVTRSIPDEPLLTTYWSVADLVCFTDHPCERAIATVRGVYPRPGVPFVVAFLGGLVLPPLLVIYAVAYGIRRRWVNVIALCAAVLVLALTMLDFTIDEIRFYSRPAGTDIQQRVAADAIWVTHIEADTDWCMVGPRSNRCDFARVEGVFPRRGVPRIVAVAGGVVVPIALLCCALFGAIWRPRRDKARA